MSLPVGLASDSALVTRLAPSRAVAIWVVALMPPRPGPPTVDSHESNAIELERGLMETYLIFRRNGWRTADELQEAAERSTVEGERMGEEVRWIRSYVLAERDETALRLAVVVYLATYGAFVIPQLVRFLPTG